MDKMPELKPCPFCGCGSIPEYVPRKNERLLNAPWRVHCATCGADGRRAENEKTAIAAWNTRPTAPQNAALGALNDLEAVLCNPDGKPCFEGTDCDREIAEQCLKTIHQALQSPARPVVKKLEWVEYEKGEHKYYEAQPFYLFYKVFQRDGQWFWTCSCFESHIACYSEDRAKEEAEAHWQAKIGECLEPAPKIDGLREAVETLKREPPPWTGHALTSQETSILNEQARYANIANEVIDSVLKIIDRAQLAAQEGGCLAESAKPETLHNPASDKQALHKIDGLREAVDTVVSGYDRDGIADWYVEAMDKVLDAACAQLAAQEDGEG